MSMSVWIKRLMHRISNPWKPVGNKIMYRRGRLITSGVDMRSEGNAVF